MSIFFKNREDKKKKRDDSDIRTEKRENRPLEYMREDIIDFKENIHLTDDRIIMYNKMADGIARCQGQPFPFGNDTV